MEIKSLVLKIEESARSTPDAIKWFIPPTEGALERATSKRHHIIFGRRGSGKSSLLRKAAAVLTLDRRPIAYVDLEKFKGNSYPNVLLSILIESFSTFEYWLQTAAINPAYKKTFWQKLFGTQPTRPAFNRKAAKALTEKLHEQIEKLKEMLDAADDVDAHRTSKSDLETTLQSEIGAQIAPIGGNLSSKFAYGGKASTSEENQESFRHSKTDFLHRHILEYQRLFQQIALLSDGDSYLFLDDLYHIRRIDQAKVIDYFHSIAKGNNLWLKIGTIRHRTQWYINGDPPIGIKLGDDADEINLDLTLEKYQITKQFLCQILDGFIDSGGNLTFKQILNDGGTDRLVLASGGVARDFLGIFRGSVSVARERGINDRGPKVGVEDVNTAAGDYDSTKREELKKDTDDQKVLIEEFQQVVSFCLNETKANIFLLPKDASVERKAHIAELVDLRFLHKVKDRVTLKKAPGQIFEAYMLDVSQYTGLRAKGAFEIIDDWHKDKGETLRRDKFVYDPEENSNDSNRSRPSSRSIQDTSSNPQLLAPLSLWNVEGEKNA